MDTRELKAEVARTVAELGILNLNQDWVGCDPIWSILERIADEGASVVIKIDGQRVSVEDNGRYTVIVSGGGLGDDFFRLDCNLLEEGLARAILHFAEHIWKKRKKAKGTNT